MNRLALSAVLILIVVFAVINLTSNKEDNKYDDFPYEGNPDVNDGMLDRDRSNEYSAADRTNARRHALTDKDRADFWQRLTGLPDEEAAALLVLLGQNDINTAFELSLALGALEGKQETAREALRRLMQSNVESAIAWGEHRTPSDEMNLFWAAAIDLTAGPDPSFAFELSLRTSDALRLTLLDNIFSEWAGEHREAAMSAALRLDSREERSVAHIAILTSEMNRDLGEALTWIHSLEDPELQYDLYYHAAQDWATADPSGASSFAASLAESDYKTHVAGMVVQSWIQIDPDSAMAWASKLSDQESREEAISRGIRHTLSSSPKQAADLALHLPAESDRSAALEYIISAWIEQDPDALATWIEQVPDITMRASMTRMMNDHLSAAE